MFDRADADEFITDIDPIEGLDMAMDECEDVDEWYEDDGQPDEAQEWYDFDPDCQGCLA